ncbi:MAG: hypothetical protein IJR35_08465 [Synergistaceae bacterium]|nr:hypothetical protein [Synergistaceae bacterium]
MQKGLQEGLQKGLKNGLQAGRTEGRAETQTEALRRMHEAGMDESQIKYLTDLLFGERKNI